MYKLFNNKLNIKYIYNNKFNINFKNLIKKTFSTIDENELKKFSNINNNWWNISTKAGVGPLHAMNPIRVSYINKHLDQYINKIDENNEKLNIIDIGCGGGILTESLCRIYGEYSHITGIDPSNDNIEIAQSHQKLDPKLTNINYQCISIENFLINENNHQYDILCSLEVLEHLSDVALFITHCNRLVKPGGHLFFSTINKTFLSYLITILGAEYILNEIPIGTHDWNKFLSSNELQYLLQKENIQIKDVNGMIYNPLSNEWTLSDDNHLVNYILYAQKKKNDDV